MMVKCIGGKFVSIAPPFLLFADKARNEPIHDISDNVESFSRRISSKRGMNTHISSEWIQEENYHCTFMRSS